MNIISKNNIVSALLASICGIITGHLFLMLYGVVFSYLVEIKAIEWTKNLPNSFNFISYWLYNFIVDSLVLAIVIIIVGCIIGAFVKINRIIASVISFVCFELTIAFLNFKVANEFSLFIFSPISYHLLLSAIAICLFWGSFYLGGYVRNKIR